MEETLSDAHLRLTETVIENLPWADCIKRYDRAHTLFYCDPPYWGTEGYGVDFGLEQYAIMADLARSIKGKIMISVNDIPNARGISGLNMESVEFGTRSVVRRILRRKRRN
jgi:DNA adenine methylase